MATQNQKQVAENVLTLAYKRKLIKLFGSDDLGEIKERYDLGLLKMAIEKKIALMDKIYVLKTCDNFYKIGISFDPDQRLKNIQTANPFLVKLIYKKPFTKAFKKEQIIHEILKGKKMKGEWFKLNGEEIKKIISWLDNLS